MYDFSLGSLIFLPFGVAMVLVSFFSGVDTYTALPMDL